VILTDYPSPPRPISIMYAPHRHLPRKVRVFTDWVADRFGRLPMMQAPKPEGNTGLQWISDGYDLNRRI
jgi:hypothetical protein